MTADVAPTPASGAVGPLDHTFTATLVRGDSPGAWTCAVTDWTAAFFGTRGLVKGLFGSERGVRLGGGPRSSSRGLQESGVS